MAVVELPVNQWLRPELQLGAKNPRTLINWDIKNGRLVYKSKQYSWPLIGGNAIHSCKYECIQQCFIFLWLKIDPNWLPCYGFMWPHLLQPRDWKVVNLEYLYIIIGLRRYVVTRVAYVDGRTAGDGRRPAAGRNRGLRLWWASLKGDVTPARDLRGRTDGRAGTSSPTAERRDGLLV